MEATRIDPKVIDDVKQLLLKLAVIANQIDTRSADALQRIESSTATLDKGANRLVTGADRLTEEVVQAIGKQASKAITQGGGQALEGFVTQLKHSADIARSTSDHMQQQRMRLERAQRALIWKGLTALVIGSILAVGGSGYLVWKNMRELERADFGRDILQAAESGRLTRCGEDKALSVRVGETPRRAGEGGEYLLIEE